MAETYADLMGKAHELNQEAQRLQAAALIARRREAEEAEALREARKPKEPVIGTVIRFHRVLSGKTYQYAAISFPASGNPRGGGRRWAVTNTVQGDAGRYTWNGLLNFIGEANWTSMQSSTGWSDMVAPADEPAVVERVGGYGAVLRTEHVDPSYFGTYR